MATEIQARYAPELNERVMRITDANGAFRIYGLTPGGTYLCQGPSRSLLVVQRAAAQMEQLQHLVERGRVAGPGGDDGEGA